MLYLPAPCHCASLCHPALLFASLCRRTALRPSLNSVVKCRADQDGQNQDSGIDNTLAYNTQSHNLLLDQARGEHGMFALLVGLRLPHQSALEESGQTAVTVAPFDAEKTLGIEGLCREDGGKVSHSDGESCCQVKAGRRGAQSVHATGLRQNF